MDPTSGGPIHSRFDDDPAHSDAIDAFVVALAERIDELQDTEAHGDWAALAQRADALAREAMRVGYPLLAESAGEAAVAARESNAELAYKALVELTDVARRVRQGHRGSL